MSDDSNMFGGFSNIRIPGIEEATNQLTSLTKQLDSLVTTMNTLAQNQARITQGFTTMTSTITSGAGQAAGAVAALNSATGGGGGGLGGSRSFGSNIAGLFSSAVNSNLFKDVAMFPLRYMSSSLQENRSLALQASNVLSGLTYASGTPMSGATGGVFGALGRLPGGVRGDVSDMLNLVLGARQGGAFLDLGAGGAANQNTPRIDYLKAIQQMQAITPGAPVGQLTGTLNQFLTNTSAQQQSAFLTGGAFAMVGSGNRVKTLEDWANNILDFLKTQRPGSKRGQNFTYAELVTQHFPGSNIDAWLTINGVPDGMKEYFWDYALRKSTNLGTALDPTLIQSGDNIAADRLRSTSMTTRYQYQLANQLYGAYGNIEQANTWFNQLIGQATTTALPHALSTGRLAALQYTPDTVQQLLMSLFERGGTLGGIAGGIVGYGLPLNSGDALKRLGSTLAPILQAFGISFDPSSLGSVTDLLKGDGLLGMLTGTGDVGDDTGWSSVGGTSVNTLHPSMGKRVGAMMQANPRLRITSGRRDEAIQRRLKSKGFGRVSGKSSAHTRGMAADLGPRSEYPWLVANAHKFGLKSGVSHGEPWHVGFGDLGDDGIDWSSLLKLLMGENMDTASSISAVGTSVPALLSILMGAFGVDSTTNAGSLPYTPDVYGLLSAATNGMSLGLGLVPSSSGTLTDALLGISSSGPNGPRSSGSRSLAGALTALGLSASGLSSGAMVARLASYVGFSGDNLAKIVAIANRESSFNPAAHNTNAGTGDNSYGLTQINMLGSLGPARRRQFGLVSDEELLDPLVNLRAAYTMSGGSSFYPWTGYRSGISLSSSQLSAARDYMQEAGVGDVDYYAAMATPSGGGRSLQFNNTFVIGGGGGSAANGGIDVRRTATIIADVLEDQVRSRMAKVN